MYIKCWGSRGSIPVSGKEYIKYGGDTTCIEVIAKTGEIVIIDAGTGIRRLGRSLLERKKSEYYLLLTHTHWDHIMGIAFFKPLLYSNTRVFVQDRKFAGINTKGVFNEVLKPPFFPVPLKDFRADILFDDSLNNSFQIGSLSIDMIPTSHSQGSMGYKFTEDDKSFVFLTDNELGFAHPQSKKLEEYIKFVENASLLFHDAEYTIEEYGCRTGWGHSSIPDVLDLALKARVKKLGLIHLNQDRTDDQMDEIVKDSRLFFEKKIQSKDKIQADQKNSSIDCFAVSYDFEIVL
ncbi:MAG: MBL fold metallo-hydrolase [Desulfobacteraceae bacterium 4572_89]|nr:MAG: MBL fold metallo-hydrolase [Desulfobacteraceae bacterium 4572_89]